MSQLQFQQITFTKDDARGKQGKNLLGNDKNTDYRIYRYPLDIGAYDKGHYMVIHINEQRETQFKDPSTRGPGDLPTVVANRINGTSLSSGAAVSSAVAGVQNLINSTLFDAPASGEDISTEVSGAADATTAFLKNNGGPIVDFLVGAGTAFGQEFSDLAAYASGDIFKTNFTRTVKRTKDTIVLYMPDTVAFTYNQGFNELNIGSDSRTLAAIGSGVNAFNQATEFNKGFNPRGGDLDPGYEVGKALSPFLLSFLAEKSDLGRVAFAAAKGIVLNPMIELIYSTPTLRNFQFDFRFYPKSQKEAEEINRILDRLRFHHAPEISQVGEVSGAFLVPPSEFDIEFYYNGSKNPNIDKISTCVLETIDVDYAPSGFSAYEVEGEPNPSSGGTGMPVAINLRLAFKETEYKTKLDYGDRGQNANGNYNVITPSPYGAFEDSQIAGLSISQNLSGEFDSDLPQQVPNG